MLDGERGGSFSTLVILISRLEELIVQALHSSINTLTAHGPSYFLVPYCSSFLSLLSLCRILTAHGRNSFHLLVRIQVVGIMCFNPDFGCAAKHSKYQLVLLRCLSKWSDHNSAFPINPVLVFYSWQTTPQNGARAFFATLGFFSFSLPFTRMLRRGVEV